MPALPIIAGVYRAAFHCNNGAGQDAMNVMHFHDQAGTGTEAKLFESLQDNVTTNMWASTGSGFVIDSVAITKLDGVSATIIFATGGGAQWQGGGVGEILPSTAVVVKFSTGLRGRSFRGRAFIPMTSEAGVTAGFLGGGTAALMQTAWENFLAAMSADPDGAWDQVVASYKHAVSTAISNVLVELALGTQRRRQSRNR